MAPTPIGTASCMYSPRRLTVRTASAKPIAPAATSAEYSPRLCPATQSGRAPRASRGRKGRDARRQDRRLGVRGQLQVGLGPLEAEPRQREAEGPVRLLEGGPALGKGLAELLPHPDHLRALAGEDERDAHALAASLRSPEGAQVGLDRGVHPARVEEGGGADAVLHGAGPRLPVADHAAALEAEEGRPADLGRVAAPPRGAKGGLEEEGPDLPAHVASPPPRG